MDLLDDERLEEALRNVNDKLKVMPPDDPKVEALLRDRQFFEDLRAKRTYNPPVVSDRKEKRERTQKMILISAPPLMCVLAWQVAMLVRHKLIPGQSLIQDPMTIAGPPLIAFTLLLAIATMMALAPSRLKSYRVGGAISALCIAAGLIFVLNYSYWQITYDPAANLIESQSLLPKPAERIRLDRVVEVRVEEEDIGGRSWFLKRYYLKVMHGDPKDPNQYIFDSDRLRLADAVARELANRFSVPVTYWHTLTYTGRSGLTSRKKTAQVGYLKE